MADLSYKKWFSLCRKHKITNRAGYRARAKELGLPLRPDRFFGKDLWPGFCALSVDTKLRSANLPDVVEKARNYIAKNGVQNLNDVVARICLDVSKRRGVRNILINYTNLHTNPLRLVRGNLMLVKNQHKCTLTLDEARVVIRRLGIKTYRELIKRRSEVLGLTPGIYRKYGITWNELMGVERRYYCEDLLPREECLELFKRKIPQLKKHCPGMSPSEILSGGRVPREMKEYIYSEKVLTIRFPKKFYTTYGALPASVRKELKALWKAA